MKNYIVKLTAHYINGKSEYTQILNADSQTEALQLFMDSFNYSDVDDNDQQLLIHITVNDK